MKSNGLPSGKTVFVTPEALEQLDATAEAVEHQGQRIGESGAVVLERDVLDEDRPLALIEPRVIANWLVTSALGRPSGPPWTYWR